MVPVQALLLIGVSVPIITGQTNLPTLPEAIQLFQVESMNKLRQTIQDQESVIADQQAKIADLDIAVLSLEEAMDLLSKGLSRLREETETKTEEAKEVCEAEKAHLREKCDLELKKREAKCEEESERTSTKLDQCESTIVYMAHVHGVMGNVMVQINQVMSDRQSLVEDQAVTIREANEEIQRQRNVSFICEAAANTTALQAEAISSLRSSLASALNLPQLSTADLQQLDVAPFMLELMESYNKQTTVIEDFKTELEKERMVDESISSIAEGLANLATASNNLDIVDQQAQVIEKQGRLIAQLVPVLQNTSKDIVWYEKAEDRQTGAQSVSSCSCPVPCPERENLSNPTTR